MSIDPIVKVAEGEVLQLRLHRPKDGEWRWILEKDGSRSRHSTLLVELFTTSELERISTNFSWGLNPEVCQKQEGSVW
jgi:hypothetical protein